MDKSLALANTIDAEVAANGNVVLPADLAALAASALRAQAMAGQTDEKGRSMTYWGGLAKPVTVEMIQAGERYYATYGLGYHPNNFAELYLAMRPLDPYVVALERDARRYRWLRDNLQILAGKEYSRIMGKHIDGVFDDLSAAVDSQMQDAAIDQAPGESDGQV
mgnify:CR=1 FL=1